MLLAILATVIGLVLLVWSADRFVEGAAATAKHLGAPTLLIGIVIIGFGTSAPELMISALAAFDGSPSLALGNAYGSNIANIGLVLGLVALINPIRVHSKVIRKELPMLFCITLLAGVQLWNGSLSRFDALVLLLVFAGIMGWSIWQGVRGGDDSLGVEVDTEMLEHPMPLKAALVWLGVGLLTLLLSSRMLVWGAVTIAEGLGVSELIIGLTVVAVGTSLPELASSVAAIRKNEHDLALGNIIGSGIFNTLAVVGIAAAIHPLEVEPLVLQRDWVVMAGLTVALFGVGYGFKGRQGRINRIEGAGLLSVYIAYNAYLAYSVLGGG